MNVPDMVSCLSARGDAATTDMLQEAGYFCNEAQLFRGNALVRVPRTCVADSHTYLQTSTAAFVCCYARSKTHPLYVKGNNRPQRNHLCAI